MRVEILGSGGAVTIPRPGCQCRVCVEAREKGVPYARTGPSVFVHGPDVLIDTPEESKQQLNRSQVTRIAAGLYSHWHPDHTAGRRVWESRNFEFRSWPRRFETTPIYVPERVWADFEAHYGLADQFRFMERQGTVRDRTVAESEPFELDGTADHADPARRRERARVPLRGRRQARADRDGRDAPLDAARPRPARPRRAPGRRLRAPPVHRRADDPGGVLQAAGAQDALRDRRSSRRARSAPRRTVLTHVEEMDRVSHDELVRLGAADGWEPAYDGMLLDRSDAVRTRAALAADARRIVFAGPCQLRDV